MAAAAAAAVAEAATVAAAAAAAAAAAVRVAAAAAARQVNDDVIVCFEEASGAVNSFIKATRLDADGEFVWDNDFVTMCSVASSKVHSEASNFAYSQIICAWEDNRNGGNDIFAQNINLDGTLGVSVMYGTIEGNVTLNGGSGNVEDVEVAAGSVTVHPDANGDYIISIIPGTYPVMAGLAGYETVVFEDVVVTEGNATTGIDFTLVPVVSSENIIIAATKMESNYPNPFNPITNISYTIKETGLVTIEVYNLRGQLVKTLVNELQGTGSFIAVWDGTDTSNKSVSSGIYLYKMKSNNYTSTKKMILMK